MIHRLLITLIALLCSGMANAQVKQTVDGAQKFLASVSESGNARAYVVGGVNVEIVCVPAKDKSFDDCRSPYKICVEQNPQCKLIADEGYKNTIKYSDFINYAVSADLIRSVDGSCRTLFQSMRIDGSENNKRDDYSAVEYRAISSNASLTAQVDWGSASIKRGAWHGPGPALWYPNDKRGVVVQSGGGAEIEYISDEPALLDRIEFAMQFLKASCDKTADTGF